MTKSSGTSTREISRAKAMARTIVEHHFGKKPKRITYQPSGLSNFVFLVDHSEGEFVVRVSLAPSRINSYIKEQWAMAKANEAGVPTPEVLEVGNEVVPHPYMIARKVAGKEATHHPDRLPLVRSMGRFAAIINTIRTSGFGGTFEWSNNQLSRNESWRDYLNQELQLQTRLKTLEKGRMLLPPQLKKLRSILENSMKGHYKPALTHGDIRLKNVMVDAEGKITAFIDWEDCTSNLAPHWELSIALHDLTIDEKREFLKGYGLKEKKLYQIAPLMKAINIINYASYVEAMLKSKDQEQIEQFRMRMHGALDLYSL
jgi:hygromycin-B 4-O-kinase